MNRHLDGNSLAGPFSELFRCDPTLMVGRCDACGTTSPLAAAIVYSSDMGDVVRCANCDNVLMTHVRTPAGVVLSTQGLTWLRVASEPESEVLF